MNGSEIALDTNQAIAVLNDSDDTGAWIAGFSRVHLPVPAIGELRFGALKSNRAKENHARVEALVSACNVLDADVTTADVYASVRLRLSQTGRPIPENDVWIAALCVQHGLTLATSDRHFAHVEGLEVVMR